MKDELLQRDDEIADLVNQINQLKAERDAEHNEAEHYRTEASNLYLANENLQEEVAKTQGAAYVRGLECAHLIASVSSSVAAALNAIQAEIDKASK